MHSGTSKPVQRLDLEVVTEGMNSLIEKERITVIWKTVPETTQSLELLIRDKELRRRQPGQFVLQLLAIGELGEGEFTC